MSPLINDADNKKEGTCANAMIEHLVDRPLHTLHVEGKHAQHHVAEVTHAGECHESLQVVLHHGD